METRVAILVETSGSIGREMLRGIVDWTRAHASWQLVLEPGDATRTALSPSWRVDGIIARSRSAAHAQAIAACDVPRVLLGHRAAPPRRQRHSQDVAPWWRLEEAATLAVAHLREQGLVRLAFCDHPEYGDFGRATPFAVACGSRLRWKRPDRGDARLSLRNWLDALPKPCGIWAANDAAGLIVLDACAALGVAVPGGLAVLGCDNDEFLCELAQPALSSIAVPAYAAGRAAAEMLAARLGGKRLASPAPLPCMRVLTRASSEATASNDALVAAAAQRLSAGSNHTTVADVAHRLGVSVRSVERRCRQILGTSPGQLRRRKRLEAAQRLLAGSNLPIAEIARRCGYAAPARLVEAMRAATNLTPTMWRRRWGC